MQGALERWIGCSKWTDIDEASAAAALVIALAERRLFCPSLYLSNLLADGSIEGAAGEGEAANSHVSMLQHLHHRMHFLAQGPSEEDRGLVPVSPSVYEKNRRMALQKAKGVGYDTSRRAAKRQKRELVGKAGEGSAEGAYVPSLRLMIARALGIEASTALGSAPPPKGWDGISAEALAGRLARLPPWKRRRLGAWLEDMVLEAFKGGCPSQTDSQELPPDLMLLRAVALLDAADSHAAASRLLLSLLEDHSRAAAASSAQAALRFPKGRKVMTEALLAALRSRLDLLSSDLLLLRAVKASIGWLFEEGVSHSLAGANGDLMMAFGAELLESSAPSVTSWWEEKSLSAGHQQWAVMTVQRMRQSSAGRLEALQQLVEALQAALSRSPVLRLGLEACQALRCPGGDPLEAAGCLWRWASEADRPKSCGAALLVCGVIAESAVRALALEMSSRGGGGRGLLPSKAALCRHRHLRALSHVRELSEGGDDISAYIVAAALRTRAADASREVGMFLSGAILYGQAVLQDALQLTGSLGGLEAPIWAGSLLGRASMRGADFGEAAVMRGLQVQLSLEAAHLALARTLEPAVISGRSLATKDLLEHLPIRLCALKDPWRLYHLLVERKGLQPYDIGVDRCHSLPSRLLVWSLVEGRLYSMAEAELATPQERQAEMAGLLQDLSPSNFELYCLKLRLLLDEQVSALPPIPPSPLPLSHCRAQLGIAAEFA